MRFNEIIGQVENWDNFFAYLNEWVIEPSKDGIYSKSFVEDCFSISRQKFYIENILQLEYSQPNFGEILIKFDEYTTVIFCNNNIAELLFDVISFAKSF